MAELLSWSWNEPIRALHYELDLSNTDITDAGLVPLQSFPALKRLNLTNTHTTDEGIKALQQARPRLEIKR